MCTDLVLVFPGGTRLLKLALHSLIMVKLKSKYHNVKMFGSSHYDIVAPVSFGLIKQIICSGNKFFCVLFFLHSRNAATDRNFQAIMPPFQLADHISYMLCYCVPCLSLRIWQND